jgi:hypothetical protein
MPLLTLLFIAALSGLAGLFLGGFIAGACVHWYNITSREGASGYFIIVIAVLSGLVATLVGGITARIVANDPTAGTMRSLGAALAAVLLLAGISVTLCRLLAPDAITHTDPSPSSPTDPVVPPDPTPAIPPADAPLSTWLTLLDEPDLAASARAQISSRPDLVEELRVLALAESPDSAAAALRFIGNQSGASPQFIPVVQAAGIDLAERMRRFNSTSIEADPSYQGAADLSVRFNGWMQAAQNLREHSGADLTPELQTLLELSRIRTDSHVIRSDICRVASFHLHLWAGIPPLPSDPSPR